jgi:hypothetical protein
MSGRKVAVLAGLAVALQASVLWFVNGWNASHGIMYLISVALLGGAFAARLAERDD